MKLLFNFSSNTGLIDKDGTINANGLGSYAIIPVGATVDFATRFNNEWTTNYVSQYASIAHVSDEINTLDTNLQSLIGDNKTSVDLALATQDGINASVTNTFGSYVSKTGAAASMWGMSVDANGSFAGMTLGALSDGPTSSSFIKFNADYFGVFDGADNTQTDGAGNQIAMFSISPNAEATGHDIHFNGVTIFENLSNGAGQTVIDGGRLKTNYIDVGQPLGESASLSKHLGTFLDEVAVNTYLNANPSVVLYDGDTYLNQTIGVIMFYELATTSWITTQGNRGSLSTNIEVNVDHTQWRYPGELVGDWRDVVDLAGCLDGVILHQTSEGPIEGDNVYYTYVHASAGYTKKAMYTSGWVTDVVATFHGDVIVDGTVDATKIVTNSLTANQINVDNLFAEDITASGTITGGTIIGTNISAGILSAGRIVAGSKVYDAAQINYAPATTIGSFSFPHRTDNAGVDISDAAIARGVGNSGGLGYESLALGAPSIVMVSFTQSVFYDCLPQAIFTLDLITYYPNHTVYQTHRVNQVTAGSTEWETFSVALSGIVTVNIPQDGYVKLRRTTADHLGTTHAATGTITCSNL